MKIVKFFQWLAAKIGRRLMDVFIYVAYRPKVRFINPDRHSRKFNGTMIFVGNHTSHMDGLYTSVIFGRNKSHIIVAKDWYEKPKFKWFLENNRTIPMDRYKADTEWLRYAKAAIARKESVIIYPEGKVSKDGEIDEFKAGFLMLALMTGTPIVPYAVSGPYKPVFGPRQKIIIGEPTPLTEEGKGLNAAYMMSESERFRQIVSEYKKKLEGDK